MSRSGERAVCSAPIGATMAIGVGRGATRQECAPGTLRRWRRKRPRWGYPVGSPILLEERQLGQIDHSGPAADPARRAAIVASQAQAGGAFREGWAWSAWKRRERERINLHAGRARRRRRFRILNVLDTVTRECLAIKMDTSPPGRRVVCLLRPPHPLA